MYKVYKKHTRRNRFRKKHTLSNRLHKTNRRVRKGINKTRKLKKSVGGGMRIFNSFEHHWLARNIDSYIVPHLVHGKIITREQIILRILTVVFIQLVRTDLIYHYTNNPHTIPTFPLLRSFKQNADKKGDTLITRGIPHLMTFFNYKDEMEKTKIEAIKGLEIFKTENLSPKLVEYYDTNGNFMYNSVEEHIKYKMDKFLSSPYTDKKYGTFDNSKGKYDACMLNILGIANMIYNRSSLNANFKFRLQSQLALKSYMIKYIQDAPGDKKKKIYILNQVYIYLILVFIFSSLLGCAEVILLLVYTKIMVPKCNLPITILCDLIIGAPNNIKAQLEKMNANVVTETKENPVQTVSTGSEQTNTDTERTKENPEQIVSTGPEQTTTDTEPKENEPIKLTPDNVIIRRLRMTIPFIHKIGGYMKSTITSIMGPSFWLKQMIAKSYYVEQKNMYAIMNVFGADRINLPPGVIDNPEKAKSTLKSLDNWLEPKNSFGIGMQESDIKSLQDLKEFNLIKKYVNFKKVKDTSGNITGVTLSLKPNATSVAMTTYLGGESAVETKQIVLTEQIEANGKPSKPAEKTNGGAEAPDKNEFFQPHEIIYENGEIKIVIPTCKSTGFISKNIRCLKYNENVYTFKFEVNDTENKCYITDTTDTTTITGYNKATPIVFNIQEQDKEDEKLNEFLEVIHVALSRVSALYTTNYNSYPFYAVIPVIREFINNNKINTKKQNEVGPTNLEVTKIKSQ